ncbi:MAG: aldehyde dehydrogenase family protein [Phycisphaerales bacterium]|nr:aldehyde dehydrogenase family protein [Phycisphaerales bacterium]
MPERLNVTKTYKLFIGGAFPRTESGRSMKVAAADGPVVAHLCRASRKDLRDAVEAARAAHVKWAAATAYLRAQVLYRLAEMMEGKRRELEGAVAIGGGIEGEVARAIDRVVHYAGWADKYPQALGCANPVAGPYHNFTVPEPVGVVGVVCPDDAPLLGLVSLVAPVVCAGNACVVLASERSPVAACVLAEAIATSDMPGGVVNILTGLREELIPHFASHRGIDAIHAAGVGEEHRRVLELGAAENLKRVKVWVPEPDWFDDGACESPWCIEPFVEFKTIWHPSGS